MNISFASNKVEKLFHAADNATHRKNIQRFFRNPHLELCMLQRIQELVNADTLYDIKKIQNANLHPLWWKRKYQLAIDVDTDSNTRWRWRIIFQQCNGDNITDDFCNDNKHKTVTDIKILELSNHYE